MWVCVSRMGKALSFIQQEEARVKAKKNLRAALQLDPACEDAALVFCDVAQQENDFNGIIGTLPPRGVAHEWTGE